MTELASRYSSFEAFCAALNEKPTSGRGRPPPDPLPIRCTCCMRKPRFSNRVPIACECGARAHPLAYLNLLPADQELTGAQLCRLREMRGE